LPFKRLNDGSHALFSSVTFGPRCQQEVQKLETCELKY